MNVMTTHPDAAADRARATASDESWAVPCAIIVASHCAFSVAVVGLLDYQNGPPLTYATMLLPAFMLVWLVVLFVLIGRMWKDGRDGPLRELLMACSKNRRRLAFFAGVFGLLIVQMSAFTWVKGTIPLVGGFWADPYLADFESALFGGDPWRFLHRLPEPAGAAIDLVYQYWFWSILTGLAFIAAQRPSPHKTQAVVAFFLLWALGSITQFALPSAGPVYFERLGFGPRFADLEIPRLAKLGSDLLWYVHQTQSSGVGVGISAMPSMHVATTSWLVLAFPRWRLALSLYWLVIFVGSIYLGWHYAVDGVAGLLLALLAWRLARSGAVKKAGAWIARSTPPNSHAK